MHPLRTFVVLVTCVVVIALLFGRGWVQQLVESNKRCVIPLSPRIVGMEPNDSADFALYALQYIARGDPVSQSYVCWARFLAVTKPAPQLSLGSRVAASMYNYLPTNASRASVRDEVLRALVADEGTSLVSTKSGTLEGYADDGTEVVAFNLDDGRTLRVSLLAEDGLRYVTALEFRYADGSTS